MLRLSALQQIGLVQVLFLIASCFAVPLPPGLGKNYIIGPKGFGSSDPYTNKTIDQLITGALGGIGQAANKLVSPDGKVLAELDMMLSSEQFNYLYEMPEMPDNIRKKRKAVRNVKFRWPKAQIPYEVAPYDFSTKDIYTMGRSFTEWERYTCLKFNKATRANYDRVRFQNGAGCNSALGMVGGTQELNLDANGCRYKGLYLHEIGHAVGLVHEHQLPDRDNYIRIIYPNVQPNMRIWFNKYKRDEVNSMSVPYELSSVMHYGITAFSYNGKAQTIKAIDSSREDEIGQVWRKELSFTDVKIVNLMYNCSARCEKKITCLNGGFLDENCKCICPDGSHDCQEGVIKASNCNNTHDSWDCYIWARQGECERNPTFMNKFCKKACGLCGEKEELKMAKSDDVFHNYMWQWLGALTNLTPKEWRLAGDCHDLYDTNKCYDWAQNGDCITNTNWMNRHCRKSCQMCTGTPPGTSCENVYTNSEKCDQWAREGECRINADWMLPNCPKSCRTCNGNSTVTKPTLPKCIDTYEIPENCKVWAQTNQCDKNPEFMLIYCRKSCNKCETGTCVNLYEDASCKRWAEDGNCDRNKEYMRENCRKACKLCTQEEIDRTDYPVTEPTTSPTTTGECRDKHPDLYECQQWQKNGHCNFNPDWMGKNCRKTCGLCTDEGRTVEPTTEPPSTECVDDDKSCAVWAQNGDMCTTNSGYMLIYCKKSCNNCNGCKDTSSLCPVWANGKQCERNAGYMLRYCQKSCNTCQKKRN
ncbi:unnamed protein product [Acanthosepion pharaonis]|uniref:Metalloendopeptidase n=1 Tax=Acanthosepion pharaonis TaxID=158019 RepID=A0A812DRA9_ACAPH|nr:unnamed protein product [Sepia pharaonis]